MGKLFLVSSFCKTRTQLVDLLLDKILNLKILILGVWSDSCQKKENCSRRFHFVLFKRQDPIKFRNFICSYFLQKINQTPKIFKFLNQCFARLWCWKSVSNSRNPLDGSMAVLQETLFQDRSSAKHWSNILAL